MNYLGIDYSVKNMPALDPGFISFGVWAKAYLQEADRPFRIAVERDHGKITVYETRLRGEAFAAANIRFAERKEIGSIESGKLADFVVCDEELSLARVFMGGKQICE